MKAQGHRPWWVYALAVIALCGCIVVGWSDFTPWVPRETVQQTIREAPRQVVQLIVHFVAPALLIAFLARDISARVRVRHKA